MSRLLLILFLAIVINTNVNAQDPHRFDEEINRFTEISITDVENLSVFTGSSSIRFWENLDEDCQEVQAINTGFGGSHMSDLLYFLDETVLKFHPSEVYIYEGDNDIFSGKEPKSILETADFITNKILALNPRTKIYFISAKPSPARWNFKSEYIAFNTLLMRYCESNDQLSYIDVWNPMLNQNMRPDPNIFIADSLHMNRQGYILWKDIICKKSD